MFRLPNPYHWHQPRRTTSFRRDLCEGMACVAFFGLFAFAVAWFVGDGIVALILLASWAACSFAWLTELPGRREIARTDARISRLIAQAHQEPASSDAPPSGSRRRMPPPRVRR
jgi:hypothetical protein